MDKRVRENASVVTAAEESARASAESAQETADRFAGSVGAVVQNANTQINASKALVNEAKSEVDATVAVVAQAVQRADNASASAQASAETVAGYGDRLTAVEDKAQGNKASIDHLEIETRDLYGRDAQSVKLSTDHIQVITDGLELRGTNKTPNTSVGEDDTIIANGHRIVEELAAYGSTVDAKLNAYTAMVRTTGSQDIYGNKTFHAPIYLDRPDGVPYIRQTYRTVNATDVPASTQTWISCELWDANERRMLTEYIGKRANGSALRNLTIRSFNIVDGRVVEKQASLILNLYSDGYAELRLVDSNNNDKLVATTRP